MCRWIAYSGAPIALSRYVTEPAHSLISQSLHALESTAGTNGDGFGMGWYDGYPEPGRYREVRPAWSDENLQDLCRHIRSPLFFAHIRAATATPVTRVNCHPFAYGRWLFMHNGFIANWAKLRRDIEALIPDELYAARTGTTDSEAIFLAIMGAGVEDDPVAATRSVMRSLTEMVEAGGPDYMLRFTAALSDGESIYAFRYAAKDAANTLYYRSGPEGAVIASEPLDGDRARWSTVPESSVLAVKPGAEPQISAFVP